ncbi:DUF1573 domain-containing protein [Cellulophaga baltica]|uniref:DUF1573 domain-containing protein n=1 Tax=Cellulophaga TaxID=104264 RepID=UPI001C065D96|nr:MULTISPECIES: DUF1573 domain-containing protein [Cellulophaga]MBU2996863.1 DUF1573 domain-containing protein [Cellulophaga baltica]MDO6768260.1 DUF1573 domain-containing protein [Cellulophaga sp. 1_MG-2023]
MRKIVITLNVLLLIALVSCKDDAKSKVNTTNVQAAAERDDAAKKLPVMTFEKVEHDFGNIIQSTPQETVFKFTNTGDAPLIITNAKSTCGCTVPEKPEGPIAPGETGELLVKFNGSGKNAVTKVITVSANTAKGTEQLKIKAFVTPKDSAPVGPLKNS